MNSYGNNAVTTSEKERLEIAKIVSDPHHGDGPIHQKYNKDLKQVAQSLGPKDYLYKRAGKTASSLYSKAPKVATQGGRQVGGYDIAVESGEQQPQKDPMEEFALLYKSLSKEEAWEKLNALDAQHGLNDEASKAAIIRKLIEKR